jgi:hypothetical protein
MVGLTTGSGKRLLKIELESTTDGHRTATIAVEVREIITRAFTTNRTTMFKHKERSIKR